MNIYRCSSPDGSLDKKYLRVCVVYRLLKNQHITKPIALRLLAQRHTAREMKTLRATVELWLSGPLKHLASIPMRNMRDFDKL
jgi:hypothetical protein